MKNVLWILKVSIKIDSEKNVMIIFSKNIKKHLHDKTSITLQILFLVLLIIHFPIELCSCRSSTYTLRWDTGDGINSSFLCYCFRWLKNVSSKSAVFLRFQKKLETFAYQTLRSIFLITNSYLKSEGENKMDSLFKVNHF